MLHFLAPLVIIVGVAAAVLGLFWLIAAGADDDGGPQPGPFYLFGSWYLALRVLKALSNDPMSVLPAFAFLLAGATLIWLGIVML